MLHTLKNTDDDTRILHAPRGRARVVRDAFRLLLRRTELRVAAGVRSPATLDMQQEHVRYLLERLAPATPLERVTPARIAKVLEREGQGRRGRKLSGGTLRKRASTLSQALELARGRAPRLPEIPYQYTPRAEHLPDFDAYQLMRDALPPARRRWFVVAIWTGQRRIDVEGMRREHLDCDERWVRIRSTKTAGRGRPGGRFYAAPELVAELAAHWRALPAGAKLLEPWPHVSSQLTRLAERLELPRTTAHRLRHTFFTWFVAANGFTAELLELGGWKDLTMPSRIYAHAAPVRFQEQIERTHRLVVERRSPQKISHAGEKPEPSVDGAVPPTEGAVADINSDGPGTAHDGHVQRDQAADATAQRPPGAEILALGDVGSPRVGAERIELSTNGLRVRSAAPPENEGWSRGLSRREPCERSPNVSTRR